MEKIPSLLIWAVFIIPMIKFKKAKDGEWIQPIKKGYLMKCCDCGLIHKIDFRIKKNKVQFRAFRKNKI